MVPIIGTKHNNNQLILLYNNKKKEWMPPKVPPFHNSVCNCVLLHLNQSKNPTNLLRYGSFDFHRSYIHHTFFQDHHRLLTG